ncbi:beta strand repeat-containing protein [Rickettsiales bacterium LUAb2]
MSPLKNVSYIKIIVCIILLFTPKIIFANLTYLNNKEAYNNLLVAPPLLTDTLCTSVCDIINSETGTNANIVVNGDTEINFIGVSPIVYMGNTSTNFADNNITINIDNNVTFGGTSLGNNYTMTSGDGNNLIDIKANKTLSFKNPNNNIASVIWGNGINEINLQANSTLDIEKTTLDAGIGTAPNSSVFTMNLATGSLLNIKNAKLNFNEYSNNIIASDNISNIILNDTQLNLGGNSTNLVLSNLSLSNNSSINLNSDNTTIEFLDSTAVTSDANSLININSNTTSTINLTNNNHIDSIIKLLGVSNNNININGTSNFIKQITTDTNTNAGNLNFTFSNNSSLQTDTLNYDGSSTSNVNILLNKNSTWEINNSVLLNGQTININLDDGASINGSTASLEINNTGTGNNTITMSGTSSINTPISLLDTNPNSTDTNTINIANNANAYINSIFSTYSQGEVFINIGNNAILSISNLLLDDPDTEITLGENSILNFNVPTDLSSYNFGNTVLNSTVRLTLGKNGYGSTININASGFETWFSFSSERNYITLNNNSSILSSDPNISYIYMQGALDNIITLGNNTNIDAHVIFDNAEAIVTNDELDVNSNSVAKVLSLTTNDKDPSKTTINVNNGGNLTIETLSVSDTGTTTINLENNATLTLGDFTSSPVILNSGNEIINLNNGATLNIQQMNLTTGPLSIITNGNNNTINFSGNINGTVNKNLQLNGSNSSVNILSGTTNLNNIIASNTSGASNITLNDNSTLNVENASISSSNNNITLNNSAALNVQSLVLSGSNNAITLNDNSVLTIDNLGVAIPVDFSVTGNNNTLSLANNANLDLKNLLFNVNFQATNFNNLNLGDGASIVLSDDKIIRFSGSSNIILANNSSITNNLSSNNYLLTLNGANNSISIGNNVSFTTTNQLTSAIYANAGSNNTITITGDSHDNYKFNFMDANSNHLNLDGSVNNFSLNGSNQIYLSDSGNNIITAKTNAANTFNLAASAIKFCSTSGCISGGDNTFIVTGGGTINITTNLIDSDNDFTLSGSNNTLILDNSNFTSNIGNIKFLGNTSNFNINSQNQAVIVDLSPNSQIDATQSNNTTLNINYNPTNPNYDLEVPKNVTLQADVSGFKNINLGLSEVTMSSYYQNDDLNMSIALAQSGNQIINGHMIFTNGANFNNKKINLTLNGMTSYINYLHNNKGSAITIDLMDTYGANATISGIEAQNFQINSMIFKVDNINIDSDNVSLVVSQCTSFNGALNGNNCDDNSEPNGKYANDKNAQSLTKYLDINTQNGNNLHANQDVNSIVESLANYNSSQLSDYYQFLVTLQPINNEILLNLAANNINNFLDAVLRPHSLNGKDLIRTWVSSNYNNSSISNLNYISGARATNINSQAGIEKDISTYNLLGLAFGYTYSNIDGNNNLFNGKAQSISGAIYNKIRLSDNFYLKTVANIGINNFSLTRHITATNHTNSDLNLNYNPTSTPTSLNTGFNNSVFYQINSIGYISNMVLYAGSELSMYNINKYNEEGDGALSVSGYTSLVTNEKIGFIVNKFITLNQTNTLLTTISTDLGYMTYKTPNTTANFVGMNTSNNNYFTNYSANYNKLSVTPKFNLTYMYRAKLTLDLFVSNTFNKDLTNTYYGLDAKYSF